MAPKVSIVTCSHDRPAFLRAAIESVRAQTDPDWEHLIYDDASTNADVRDVLEWAKHDPRVRIWRSSENHDQPSAIWNFLMDRAHGKYLTVLDDDNEKLPTFVEAMSRELDADSGLDVVTCGWRVDRVEGGSAENYFLNLSTSEERLRVLSTCDGGAMLYRREAFERAGYFSEAIRTNEDWDWLRRAVHCGKIKNLHEVHSTYRSHGDNRMRRAGALGNDADVAAIRARRLSSMLGVTVAYPPGRRLTRSQTDVCGSVAIALAAIPWVSRGSDLCVVVSPFQMSDAEISKVRDFPRVLSLHMEDPYALVANLARVQFMTRYAETWVCTNDAATLPYYRKVVGDRVIVCPSLSADASLPAVECDRDVDVLLCGYAYPSRRRFVDALLPMLRGLRVILVGDGWGESARRDGVAVMPTQPLSDTYRLHARARAVACLHRARGDCSDGPVEPATVNRGFMEGYSAARVFLDRARPCHALDEGDVVWYAGPGDLAGALRAHLAVPGRDAAADRFSEKCRTIYTYRARLARVLNCVRAPRFLAEIP
jgi:hypothetical protein